MTRPTKRSLKRILNVKEVATRRLSGIVGPERHAQVFTARARAESAGSGSNVLRCDNLKEGQAGIRLTPLFSVQINPSSSQGTSGRFGN